MSQDSLGAIVLQPVTSLDGPPGGDALVNYNTNVVADGAICYVSGNGQWILNKSADPSTADGVTTIAPIVGPGVWYSVQGTRVSSVYANVAALRAVPVAVGAYVVTLGSVTPGVGYGNWIGKTGSVVQQDNTGTIVTEGGIPSVSYWERLGDLSRPYPEWFGNVTTLVDSQASIDAAIAWLVSQKRGVVLFESKDYPFLQIVVPEQITLEGTGFGNTLSLTDCTRLVKAVSNNPGVILNGSNAQLRDLIVIAQTGDTADLIQLASGTSCNITRVAGMKAGRDGFRIGSDVGPSNVNQWVLNHVIATDCSRDGFNFDDKPGNPSDANAGSATAIFSRHNGRHGIRLGNAWLNKFSAYLTEGNTGYGVFVDDNAKWTDFLGGDSEGNLAGEYFTSPLSREVKFYVGQTDEPLPFADGDTTPDVSARKNFTCFNSAPTTITNFDNGSWGQIIQVRLDGNTTIASNANIQLERGVSITGDSNSILTFRKIVNVWFEIARNFDDTRRLAYTISGGAITWNGGNAALVDTEGGAPTDDLTTILNPTMGVVLIVNSNFPNTVVAKDGIGNLQLEGDFTMNHPFDRLTLISDGINWYELARSNNN